MVHPACPLNVECKKTMHIMENNRFKVIIVEDVKLELKGTEEILSLIHISEPTRP